MCKSDGIMFKDDRPRKIPRLQRDSYICNKDHVPVVAATSLTYLSLGNTISNSEITKEAPFDSKIIRGWSTISYGGKWK